MRAWILIAQREASLHVVSDTGFMWSSTWAASNATAEALQRDTINRDMHHAHAGWQSGLQGHADASATNIDLMVSYTHAHTHTHTHTQVR